MARRVQFDRGRWQVERERCQIPDARPRSRQSEPVRMGDIVAGALKQLGPNASTWVRGLESEWLELVGTPLARHARPGKYREGNLVVFVDSSTWLNEIKRYHQATMLAKLRARFGEDRIKSLVVQVDPEG